MGALKSFLGELIAFSTPRAVTINIFFIFSLAFLTPIERVSWIPVRSLWGMLGISVWSIGLTRATVLFMHGRIDEAIAMNPLVLPVVFMLCILFVLNVVRWYRVSQPVKKS